MKDGAQKVVALAECAMSVLVNEKRASSSRFHRPRRHFHAQQMIEYGTNVVGGVTPAKAERNISSARLQHGADAAKAPAQTLP